MNKNEIIEQLNTNHKRFTSYFVALSDGDFVFSLNNSKWSPARQADHILRSLSPVSFLFGWPKLISKLIFKKANRPSKSYEKLIEKYLFRLESGGRASGRFVPGEIKAASKPVLARNIETVVTRLCSSLNKYSEDELDSLVLPHPLLGKVTLREMLYFTIYHVDHHLRITQRDLGLK